MKKIYSIVLIFCLSIPLIIMAETEIYEPAIHEGAIHEAAPEASSAASSCDSPRNVCEFCECALKKPLSDPDRISYITQCKLDCQVDLK